MKRELPAWAMKKATPQDLALAREAQRLQHLQVRWPDLRRLREWARRQGWPAPWLSFETAFVTKMLEDETKFALALGEGGLEVRVPKKEHTVGSEQVAELDALYAERSADGRPTHWGLLVEALREIRRAVEAGVVVTIEGGPALRSWQAFYDWAHKRYHMLEDGYDSWIGHDDS